MKKSINEKINSKISNKIFPVAFALVLLFNVIFIITYTKEEFICIIVMEIMKHLRILENQKE